MTYIRLVKYLGGGGGVSVFHYVYCMCILCKSKSNLTIVSVVLQMYVRPPSILKSCFSPPSFLGSPDSPVGQPAPSSGSCPADSSVAQHQSSPSWRAAGLGATRECSTAADQSRWCHISQGHRPSAGTAGYWELHC